MKTIENTILDYLNLENLVKWLEVNSIRPKLIEGALPKMPRPTFYVNKAKKTIVCKNAVGEIAKVKLQDGDQWNEYTGMLAAYIKLNKRLGLDLGDISKAKVVHQDTEPEPAKDFVTCDPWPDETAEQTPTVERSGRIPDSLKDPRWLAFWLDRNNVSIQEAAQLCGLSFSTIERASQGFFVRPASFKKIVEGLGLSDGEATEFKGSLVKHQRWVY